MVANSRAKKIGATSANSTAAEPRWLRRKRRRTFAGEAAGEDIKATSRHGRISGRGLPETDCGSVSSDADGTTRSVRRILTMPDDRPRSHALRFAPRKSRELGASSVGFGAGGRRARGLAGKRAGLVDRGLEIILAVAERDPALADRSATIGFAFDAAVDGDEPFGRAFDHDLAIHQHVAGAVHRDKIGRTIALAGDNDDATALQRDIGDQRVSDNDGRDLGRHLEQLGLIDKDRDLVVRRAKAHRRPQQCYNRKGTQSKTCARTNTLEPERHTLPRGVTSRQKRYTAEPAPDGVNLTTIHERSA